MKSETDPITGDEWLVRIVFRDKFTVRVPVISPNAFEPREKGRDPDTTGISLYRRACLSDPADVLCSMTPDKRLLNGLVQIPVTLLPTLRLTVRSDPNDIAPGHVVIPELNIADYLAEKSRFTPIKLRLAEVASANILLRPAADPPT